MNTLEEYPGSNDAVKAGCTCSAIDNHYGKGPDDDYNRYLIIDTCPIHKHLIKQNQAEIELIRLSNANMFKDFHKYKDTQQDEFL